MNLFYGLKGPKPKIKGHMKFYEYCNLMKKSTIIVGFESRVIENYSNYNSSYLRITRDSDPTKRYGIIFEANYTTSQIGLLIFILHSIGPLLNKLFFEYSNIGTYERLKNQNVFRIVIVN